MRGELIARVESATGGDRDLDWRIAKALCHPEMVWPDIDMWPPFMVGSKADKAIPAFTASVDAALDLVERVLAGKIGPISLSIAGSALAGLEPNDPCGWSVEAFGATPPIALILATLKALHALPEPQDPPQ